MPPVVAAIAVNGQAGLNAITHYQSDLVITDILIPKMDGVDMAERIRAMNSKAPIVTTAFVRFYGYTKPVFLGEVLSILKLDDSLLNVV